jgi:hypothetical protein
MITAHTNANIDNNDDDDDDDDDKDIRELRFAHAT